jgi:hypothetical protein
MYDDYDGLIERLRRWTRERGTFQGDRALSDEAITADGWEFFEDPDFEGGQAWRYGTNPQVFTSHANRPHPVLDLNAALGIVPMGFDWSISSSARSGRFHATVSKRAGGPVAKAFNGESSSPCVAVMIASFEALRSEAEEAKREAEKAKGRAQADAEG